MARQVNALISSWKSLTLDLLSLGTAKNNLPSFLDKVRGEQLCISLLLDPSFCHDYDIGSDSTQQTPTLPNMSSLKETIAAFKLSLSVTDDDVRAIEQNTREQRIHGSRETHLIGAELDALGLHHHFWGQFCVGRIVHHQIAWS